MFAYRSLFDRPEFNALGWDDIFRNFDRLVRDFDRQSSVDGFGYAAAELVEENDRYVLTVEVPGVTENDIKVDFQKGVLTVSAERKPKVPEGYSPRRRERGALGFSRSFLLGDAADPEATTATLKDGILTVSIAKSKGNQKRTITVKAS